MPQKHLIILHIICNNIKPNSDKKKDSFEDSQNMKGKHSAMQSCLDRLAL